MSQKSFLICVPNITKEEFLEKFGRKIRKSNGDNPGCKFVLGDGPGDRLAQDFLKHLGVDPSAVTIFYRSDLPPNPHGYETTQVHDNNMRVRTMIYYTTEDIELGSSKFDLRVKIARKNFPEKKRIVTLYSET